MKKLIDVVPDIDTGPAPAKYTVDAVNTAVDILMVLAEQPNIGLSEIARRTGHGKARVFRLIRTLEARGLLVQSGSDRSYRLGYTALILGGAAERQIDLVQVAEPILATLSDSTGETAQLRVLHNLQSMCIASWEPPRDLKVNALIGRRRPLYRGTNKILLAYSSPDIQATVFKDLSTTIQRGDGPAIQAAALRRDLEQIRKDGYWVSHGDMNSGLSGVGAPVFGLGGRLVGAINISAPSERLKKNLDNAITAVRTAARSLSAHLGAE